MDKIKNWLVRIEGTEEIDSIFEWVDAKDEKDAQLEAFKRLTVTVKENTHGKNK